MSKNDLSKMELKVNKFEFTTLEEAWEGINEYLANNEQKIKEGGGGSYGTEMISYDNFIYVYKPFISPTYNFGVALGYKYKKWTKLINNYVNLDYLDLVKAEVLGREKKKASHYNYTFHFDNKHGSGKDCLISLSFCRRKNQKNPFVIYTTRASEATSRLIFDFLLIQRMIEYVYGIGVHCEVLCYIPFIYVNVERYVMYMAYKGVQKSIIKNPLPERGKILDWQPFQKRCLAKYEDFLTKDLDTIRYKVHRRAAAQVQKRKDGRPVANAPDLFAKDLGLPFRPKLKEKDIQKLNNSLDN